MSSLFVTILIVLLNSLILIKIYSTNENIPVTENIDNNRLTPQESRANDFITYGILKLCIAVIAGTFFLIIFKIHTVNLFFTNISSFNIKNFLMTFNLALWMSGFILFFIGYTWRVRLERNSKENHYSLLKLSFGSFYKK